MYKASRGRGGGWKEREREREQGEGREREEAYRALSTIDSIIPPLATPQRTNFCRKKRETKDVVFLIDRED